MRGQPEVDSEETAPAPRGLRGSRAWLWASLALCFPTVPPAVNVTRSQDLEGMVHLMGSFWASFPEYSSVVWFQDEEPMSRDAQESGVSCLMGMGPTTPGKP